MHVRFCKTGAVCWSSPQAPSRCQRPGQGKASQPADCRCRQHPRDVPWRTAGSNWWVTRPKATGGSAPWRTASTPSEPPSSSGVIRITSTRSHCPQDWLGGSSRDGRFTFLTRVKSDRAPWGPVGEPVAPRRCSSRSPPASPRKLPEGTRPGTHQGTAKGCGPPRLAHGDGNGPVRRALPLGRTAKTQREEKLP